MDKNRLFVDLHVIQTVPPSCINRDDTGSPKTAIYGGTTRARVSSQAWKHAMREYFKEVMTEEELSKRSKKVVGLLAEEIQKLNSGLNGEKLAIDALTKAGLKVKIDEKKGKKAELDALFFISSAQIQALAQLAADGCEEKESFKKALKDIPGFEIALFGRMVAADPSLNYDAASQVAHSISTHAVHSEYDYFTAVDDLAPEDNAGAGHLGTVEFNSSTLYRYATVNVSELKKWVKNPEQIVRVFAEAFIYAMPTGKQNTFANRTVPDAVYITVREDQPVNFSGAFEEAVMSRNGYSKASIERLQEYAEKSYRNFVEVPTYALGTGEGVERLCGSKSVKENLETLENCVRELLDKAGEAE